MRRREAGRGAVPAGLGSQPKTRSVDEAAIAHKMAIVVPGAGTEVRAVRSLPVREWPAADRASWAAACQPGQRLTRGGSACHLAPITQTDFARRYGYFLDFLDRSDRLDRTAEAGALVTLEAIIPFVAELQERVSSVTVSRTIYKLRRAAECIAPHRSFAWLAEIGMELALLERPKDRFDRVVLTERLVEAGLTVFREAEADLYGLPLSRALAARNGLMVALLAPCPIRLKNFAALEIGSTLVKLDEEWWIHLSERSPGDPITVRFRHSSPASLSATSRLIGQCCFNRTASTWATERGRCKGKPLPKENTRPLWISRLGCPLKYGSIALAVTETTRMTLGVPISPHLFRSAGASSAALHASKSPHLASALLHHTDQKTTEAHYIRASSLSVARDFGVLIGDLRTS